MVLADIRFVVAFAIASVEHTEAVAACLIPFQHLLGSLSLDRMWPVSYMVSRSMSVHSVGPTSGWFQQTQMRP
jgi:hypothetical protein